MLRTIPSLAAVALVCGCASYPAPVQRLAQAEAASRSAQETGANSIPQGQLHLRLANEEIARAQALMADKDNERADFVLMRAQSDAELALGEAREQQARDDARKALEQIDSIRATTPTSETTTSGATVKVKIVPTEERK
jgi:pyridoxal biosynthesis lyase PdxS